MSHLVTPKIECVESKGKFGCFVAEPLERGFGITLGSALRRVLLGSLLGAAVNWFRIEGIHHEFSTIPYVKEDVTEFLLNIKALRLRPVTKQPGKLFLEAEGEKRVYASDIKLSADFEIANPELYLATLDSAEARLYVEFNVMLGKGYVPATRDSELPIGVIPVDAIFTPVHKVNYVTKPIHAGQHAGYEKLTLDVWTDGTISPSEAVNQSTQILIEQFSPFASLALAPAMVLEERPPALAISVEQYELPLERLGLPPRVFNLLRKNRISKAGELVEKSERDLLSLEKLGSRSVEEIQQCLKAIGLALRADE